MAMYRPGWSLHGIGSLAVLGFGLFLGLLAGCDEGSLPPQANPAEARTALESALGAWQQGKSIDELAQRQPPIYFNDPYARSELELIEYKMDENDRLHGQQVRIEVKLSLRLPNGQTKTQKTGYLVDTAPAIVIVAE